MREQGKKSRKLSEGEKEKILDACRLLLNDIGSINPGEQKVVPIIFFRPELIKHELKIGDTFFIWESKNIAQGKVRKVID